MQINYSAPAGIWAIFYQCSIANKHFKVAISSSTSRKNLLKENVLEVNDSLSLLGRIHHLFLFATEWLPGLGLVIAVIDRFFNNQSSLPSALDAKVKRAIHLTPTFDSYAFRKDPETHLTDIVVRPANLFFNALGCETTLPGSGQLFQFKKPLHKIRNYILGTSDAKTITLSAVGQKTVHFKRITNKATSGEVKNLETYLGKNTYSLSYGELKNVLSSQKIYLSPLISKKFYLGLKSAFDGDNIVTLPENGKSLKEILSKPDSSYLYAFLRKVQKNPQSYGISFEKIADLTLYQIGAMVVKAEDYHCFVKNGYRLAKRNVGDQDQLKLISLSGIRNFFETAKIPGNEEHQIDQSIMKHSFKTAFEAAGKEAYFIAPAVGMGVWGGDPEIYWKAFLDAVVETDVLLENILINPGHQRTLKGKYQGYTGSEFGLLLTDYQKQHPKNENLKKIVNLLNHKTDLLLLAKNLKKQYPQKTVAFVNASDPDVTLGNHVGEYVNNVCQPATTEENFAAAGTSGINFEKISNVLNEKGRVISRG